MTDCDRVGVFLFHITDDEITKTHISAHIEEPKTETSDPELTLITSDTQNVSAIFGRTGEDEYELFTNTPCLRETNFQSTILVKQVSTLFYLYFMIFIQK